MCVDWWRAGSVQKVYQIFFAYKKLAAKQWAERCWPAAEAELRGTPDLGNNSELIGTKRPLSHIQSFGPLLKWKTLIIAASKPPLLGFEMFCWQCPRVSVSKKLAMVETAVQRRMGWKRNRKQRFWKWLCNFSTSKKICHRNNLRDAMIMLFFFPPEHSKNGSETRDSWVCLSAYECESVGKDTKLVKKVLWFLFLVQLVSTSHVWVGCGCL